ncbi:MAG: hypothetical protein ACFB0A_16705 [Croceivirga sp.]
MIAIGETCINRNDGSIKVSASKTGNYEVVMGGMVYPFEQTTTIRNLSPGNYNICVRDATDPASENCFSLLIDSIDELDVGATIASAESTTLNLVVSQGTAPYLVQINEQWVGTYENDEIVLAVTPGDTVSVTSQIACEGTFKMKVPLISNPVAYPNPT